MSLYPPGTDAAPHEVEVTLRCEECGETWVADAVVHLGALDAYDDHCPECWLPGVVEEVWPQ